LARGSADAVLLLLCMLLLCTVPLLLFAVMTAMLLCLAAG
jgi:hypothetical protein